MASSPAPAQPSDRPVVLVTNANGFVGPALSRVMARQGFDQVLHVPASGGEAFGGDIEPQRLLDVARAYDAQVELVDGVDLTTAAGNQALVDRAYECYGRLDAAAFSTGAIVAGPFLAAGEEDWAKVKRANLDMAYYALQAALPPMMAAGRGQIVIYTSAVGVRPEPNVAIYAATRAGANALVRSVGLEVAPSGVTVNAIGTNFLDFPGFHEAVGTDDAEHRARVESNVPLRRLGTMDELAEFTAVLLDGRDRFQTGQVFSFSGGWSP